MEEKGYRQHPPKVRSPDGRKLEKEEAAMHKATSLYFLKV